MEHYYSTKSFQQNCGHSYNIETYAKMNISKSEVLDLTYAYQDQNDSDIYIARYDVLNRSGEVLYTLTVRLKVSTNEYSCHKSV